MAQQRGSHTSGAELPPKTIMLTLISRPAANPASTKYLCDSSEILRHCTVCKYATQNDTHRPCSCSYFVGCWEGPLAAPGDATMGQRFALLA